MASTPDGSNPSQPVEPTAATPLSATPPLANASREGDQLAQASMVLSLIGLTGCFSFLGVPGLILSFVAKSKSLSTKGQQNAKVGLLAGAVSTALFGVIVILRLTGVIPDDPGSSATSSASAPAASSAPTAVAAASSSAADDSAPESPSKPAASVSDGHADDNPFHAVVKKGVNARSFSIDSDEDWALFPAGTTMCELSGPGGPPIKLDVPRESDEFKLKRMLSRRKEIVDKYTGQLVWIGDKGKFDSSGVMLVGTEFELAMSPYDFKAKQYKFTVRSRDKWPMSLTSTTPTFSPETATMTSDHEVAKLGGKSLTVKSTSSLAVYSNSSKLTFNVKVEPDEAEQWKGSKNVKALILMQFQGLGHHKVCTTSCMTVLGVSGCDQVNSGYGTYYRAKLIGYEFSIDDKTIASYFTPPSPAKN